MSNEKMNVNRYYLTLSSYQINPIYLDEPQVNLGCGIDLSDPLLPVVAPYSAFDLSLKAGKRTFALPKSSDVIKESFILRESLKASEESSVLSGYFKASYMLSSVKAACETAREEQKNYHTIYALLEHSGESERLPSDLRHWKKDEPPNLETISDVV
jgi:hypothetical protein